MKRLDPFYWYLRIMHAAFFSDGKMTEPEVAFLSANINKHRLAQWVNLLTTPFIIKAIMGTAPNNLLLVGAILIGPVLLLGGAWFNISFGKIQAKLINIAMIITFFMYTPFKIAYTMMIAVIAFGTSLWMLPPLAMLYLCVDISCTLYDSTDGLKPGMDDAVLRHSRAALLFYKQKGIDPPGL